MLYAIVVKETLERVVLADKPTLDQAISCVKKAYKDGKIVLDAEDVTEDIVSGCNASIEHAYWIDPKERLKYGTEVFT